MVLYNIRLHYIHLFMFLKYCVNDNQNQHKYKQIFRNNLHIYVNK